MDRKFPTHPKTLPPQAQQESGHYRSYSDARRHGLGLAATYRYHRPPSPARGRIRHRCPHRHSTTNTHEVMIYVSFGCSPCSSNCSHRQRHQPYLWEYAIFGIARVTVRRAVVGSDAARRSSVCPASSVITNRIQTLVTALVGHEVALTVTIVSAAHARGRIRHSVSTTVFRAFAFSHRSFPSTP